MAMIDDLERQVIDRFLATPASRFAIVLSQIVRSALIAGLQAVIILLVGLALGVRVHGGAPAGSSSSPRRCSSMAFAGFSQAIALLMRARRR